MKPKLYLETTIPSYLVSRPSRNLIVAAHQELTREWWEKRRNEFDLYVSQFVLQEASAGDIHAARDRIKAIAGAVILEATVEANELAQALIDHGAIPATAAIDAAHIAVAAVHRMDYLMTWNCVHIANAIISRRVRQICTRFGLECPAICTPEELLGA